MITCHKPPTSQPCTHDNYLMDCLDFAELTARAGGCCEICDIPEKATPYGMLYIDHDYDYGRWAVRGLLCSRCNPMLERGRILGPALDRYLDNAWWKQMLTRHGLGCDPLPEPPVGTWVRGLGSRIWLRTKVGWKPPVSRSHSRVGQTLLWRELHYHFGPHNIAVDPDVGVLAGRLKRTSPYVDAEAVVAAIEFGLRPVDIAELASCTDGTVYLIARRAGISLKKGRIRSQ